MPTNFFLWSNFTLRIGKVFGFREEWGIQKKKMIAHAALCHKTNGSYICCVRMKLPQTGEVGLLR